eukprot:Sspe_Gene.60901::Locus_33653_Transcript_1_1_Confidence_1.000_Length_496::g.60901::m.60901
MAQRGGLPPECNLTVFLQRGLHPVQLSLSMGIPSAASSANHAQVPPQPNYHLSPSPIPLFERSAAASSLPLPPQKKKLGKPRNKEKQKKDILSPPPPPP